MGQSVVKNPRKVMSQQGGAGGSVDPALEARVAYLEGNEYKITYFIEINGSTGTITKPTGSTILLDQFFGGVDAYVSTIANGQPTGVFPRTSGGVEVDVSSFDASGNFTLTGTPSAYPVALIFKLKIAAVDYQNLTTASILDMEDFNQGAAKGSFGIQILKGQNVITTGLQEAVLTIPYNGTITGWQIYECSTTPVSSSIVIDTWSDAYGNYPPTVLDTIWGGSKPTLTTATKAQATGLSIPVTAGNTFIFNVDSATSARNIVLIIYVTKS